MKILSLNCRNWNRDCKKSSPYYWVDRMKAINKMLKSEDADILLLQELLLPASLYVPNTYKRVGVGVSHSIWVKKGIKVKKWSFHIFCDYALISVNGNEYQIINVHSRWEEDTKKKVLEEIESLTRGYVPAIAGGDFNVGLQAITKEGILSMLSVRQLLGYSEQEDTFVNITNPASHGAIDHFFCKGIQPKDYRRITSGYGVARLSDHYPIVMTI